MPTQERFKTFGDVFDPFTQRTLFKLISQGHYEDETLVPISIGKEANVFAAKHDSEHVVIKIYRLQTADFNKMYDYLKFDPRYTSLKKKRREVIFCWAKREFRNLFLAREAGVRVPTPMAINNHILVMELIGKETPALKIKDQPPKKPGDFFEKCIRNVKKLHSSKLVHGDLSKFNILNYEEDPVFIDWSQATTTKNDLAQELLERDVRNLCTFFSQLGVDADEKSILKNIANTS